MNISGAAIAFTGNGLTAFGVGTASQPSLDAYEFRKFLQNRENEHLVSQELIFGTRTRTGDNEGRAFFLVTPLRDAFHRPGFAASSLFVSDTADYPTQDILNILMTISVFVLESTSKSGALAVSYEGSRLNRVDSRTLDQNVSQAILGALDSFSISLPNTTNKSRFQNYPQFIGTLDDIEKSLGSSSPPVVPANEAWEKSDREVLARIERMLKDPRQRGRVIELTKLGCE